MDWDWRNVILPRLGKGGNLYGMPRKKKRPSLQETVETLARIAEKHLATMPVEEQEERVAALARRVVTLRRDTPSRPSKKEHKDQSRVSARGRG
jgi:hypothetical protein